MTPRQALAAAAAIVAASLGYTWSELSAPQKERVGRYTVRQLLRGETLPASAPEALCIQFEAQRNDTGEYYEAQLLAEPGVDRTAQDAAILSRRATVMPSSIQLIELGACLATSQDPLRFRPLQQNVTAGVASCERTNPETAELEQINIRDRFPAGWDCTPSGATAQCPVRVVAGHDPCPGLIAEARGELEP